jgi:predicted RNA-binding Zn-ribbon protein involved in translation (DUF1610 family)
MVQDPNDMMFCESCRMNVFPTRQKFNIKIFGFFAILILAIIIVITIVFLPLLSGLFIFLFVMWGFIIINPYVLYYGLQKKQFCPKCFKKTIEKNIEYKPFGDKEPEIYKELIPYRKAQMTWYCPYCGTAVNRNFCKSCGKKLEIKR